MRSLATEEYLAIAWEKAKSILPQWLVRQIEMQARSSTGGKMRSRRIIEEALLDENVDDSNLLTDEVSKEFQCQFLKQSDEQQIVYGVVLEPDTVDAQGDVIGAEEIEKAAVWFMENSQTVGDRHIAQADARVVQTYIAPVDFEMGGRPVKAGSWVMAVKVYDQNIWQDVRSGELTGFSIGGYGIREASD